jgi:hypothetical protein
MCVCIHGAHTLFCTQQVDAERCRILPDGTRWLVDLWGQAADVALGQGGPFILKKGGAAGAAGRKISGKGRWLIPLVAYGQYLAWKTLLQPRLQKEEDKQVRVCGQGLTLWPRGGGGGVTR